jgi:hypothetical protein
LDARASGTSASASGSYGALLIFRFDGLKNPETDQAGQREKG